MLSHKYSRNFNSILPINPYNTKSISKKNLLAMLVLALFFISMLATQNSLFTLHQESKPINVSEPNNQTPVTPSSNQPVNNRLASIKTVDTNNNHIADGLDTKILTDNPNTVINVIVTLKNNAAVPNSIINSFKSFDGSITFKWDNLGMFAGTIPVGKIKEFVQSNLSGINPLGLIEEDRQMVKMSESDRLTNVQGYVWDNYNLFGDPNSSIAIFDTGIDASHPMLSSYSSTPQFNNPSVKVVGWYDATPDGATSPQDMDGHGSHVAAIAAGNPYNDTSINGGINVTSVNSYNVSLVSEFVSGGGYATFLNVSTPGTISQTYYWKRTGGTSSTSGTGLYLLDPSGSIVAYDTTNNPITSNSGSFSISYTVTSNFGLYELFPQFNYQDANSNLDMVTYGSYPYSSELSVLHARFSGIAPDTKIVGIKVFNNIGDGLSSFLVNGISWAIANKNTYHINIASMSLGFPCSPSGCKSTDIISAVQTAVTNLVNAGIVTFVAAGNDGQYNNDQIGTPGNINSVITVGATDNNHSVTYYSSLGPGYNSASSKPDLTAPGGLDEQGAILSADTNNNDAEGTMDGIVPDFQKNDLTPLQGTSMATPYAAAIGNLIIQAMGGYNNWNYTIANVYKVKQIMLMSTWATNGTDRTTKDIHEGWGEIQANAAIDVVKQPSYGIGSVATGDLSNAQFSNKIWGRQVTLTAGTQYNFILNMNSTLDADLYLYSNNYGTYGDPIIVKESRTNGLGATEYLSYTPTSSGNYYIYVKTWTGHGGFALSSSATVTSTSITINSPSSGASISSTTLVQVSASSSAGISLVQARFDGSLAWVNLTYNKASKTYEFSLDPTQFPNGIYHSMDVKVLDNNGKITYASVYYIIATSYTGPDTIQLSLKNQIPNQLNYVYTKQFTFNFTTSITPDSVNIYIDNQLNTTITNSSIVLKLDDGIHDIRAVAIKGTTTRSIGVTYVLVDTSPRPPIIIGPKLLYYAIGSQEQLNWYLTNPNPGNYTVFENNSIVKNGTWSNDIPISISLDNLTKGYYNFTLLAFDTTGLNSTSTTIVKSYYRAVIVGPADVTFTEGQSVKTLDWTVTDDALANYSIYNNGNIVKSSTITGTFANISYDIANLSYGNYNFTLAVYDQDNMLVTNTVIVTVLQSSILPTSQTITSTSKHVKTNPGFEIFGIGSLIMLFVIRKRKSKR